MAPVPRAKLTDTVNLFSLPNNVIENVVYFVDAIRQQEYDRLNKSSGPFDPAVRRRRPEEINALVDNSGGDDDDDHGDYHPYDHMYGGQPHLYANDHESEEDDMPPLVAVNNNQPATNPPPAANPTPSLVPGDYAFNFAPSAPPARTATVADDDDELPPLMAVESSDDEPPPKKPIKPMPKQQTKQPAQSSSKPTPASTSAPSPAPSPAPVVDSTPLPLYDDDVPPLVQMDSDEEPIKRPPPAPAPAPAPPPAKGKGKAALAPPKQNPSTSTSKPTPTPAPAQKAPLNKSAPASSKPQAKAQPASKKPTPKEMESDNDMPALVTINDSDDEPPPPKSKAPSRPQSAQATAPRPSPPPAKPNSTRGGFDPRRAFAGTSREPPRPQSRPQPAPVRPSTPSASIMDDNDMPPLVAISDSDDDVPPPPKVGKKTMRPRGGIGSSDEMPDLVEIEDSDDSADNRRPPINNRNAPNTNRNPPAARATARPANANGNRSQASTNAGRAQPPAAGRRLVNGSDDDMPPLEPLSNSDDDYDPSEIGESLYGSAEDDEHWTTDEDDEDYVDTYTDPTTYTWLDGLPLEPVLPLALISRPFLQAVRKHLYGKQIKLSSPWSCHLLHRTLTSPQVPIHRKFENPDDETLAMHKLSYYVRNLCFRGFHQATSLTRGGAKLVVELISLCPRLEEIDLNGANFLQAVQKPMLAALKKKALLKTFVATTGMDKMHPLKWSMEELASCLTSWPMIEFIDMAYLTSAFARPLPAISPKFRIVKLTNPSINDRDLMSLLKHSTEIELLDIGYPHERLSRKGLVDALQLCANTVKELRIEIEPNWNPLNHNRPSNTLEAPENNKFMMDGLIGKFISLNELHITGPLASHLMIRNLPPPCRTISWGSCPAINVVEVTKLLKRARKVDKYGNVTRGADYMLGLSCITVYEDDHNWPEPHKREFEKTCRERDICYHSKDNSSVLDALGPAGLLPFLGALGG